MREKKPLAREMCLAGYKTQKEIALALGVSERTIYTWIHQNNWDKQRAMQHQLLTPRENCTIQLLELQEAIAARMPGSRYPTPAEADTQLLLINAIYGPQTGQETNYRHI